MLLRIATTHRPATDLGYLLHKNPARLHTFELGFGTAQVFYTQASEHRCEAALLLDIDPIDLVRGRSERFGRGSLFHYVNDRPYVASSFLSVAISQVLGSALGGRSKERPELVERALPLEIDVSAVRCRSGEEIVRRVFEPLGFTVNARALALDPAFPDWGTSPYFNLALTIQAPLKTVLSQLYVLLPVLDNDKHYWVGDDEVKKLVTKGAEWLSTHPDKELIAYRYLNRRRHLQRAALERLSADEDMATPASDADADEAEARVERPISLNDHRHGAVLSVLKAAGVRRVADLGCGEGRLLERLMAEPQFERIIGVDASTRALEAAHSRLRIDRLPPHLTERIELVQGAATYADARLDALDAICLVEVIEHIDSEKLHFLEHAVFANARPQRVLVSTPNREYNVRFEGMSPGALRHADHRFEWTRSEFAAWADRVSTKHDYDHRFLPIGPIDDEVGAPTQLCVFER